MERKSERERERECVAKRGERASRSVEREIYEESVEREIYEESVETEIERKSRGS